MALALLVALSFAPAARAAEASWSFDTPSWDYGLVRPDAGPATHTFVLTNTGDVYLNGGSVGLSGGGGFGLGTSTCGYIAPGASCGIEVAFDPDYAGLHMAELEAYEIDGLVEPATAQLVGTGDAPRLTGDPAGATFSSAAVGSVSAPKTLVFTNDGTRGLTVSSVGISGTSPTAAPDQFRLLGGTCAPAVAVAPGQGCSVDVAMAPTRLGYAEATLVVASDAPGSPYRSWLSGYGSPPDPPPGPSPPPRAPTATIVHRPAKRSVVRRPGFWLSGSAGTVAFVCRLDDGEFAACESPIHYPKLRAGRHRFVVRAGDLLGQLGPPVSYRWWIRRR